MEVIIVLSAWLITFYLVRRFGKREVRYDFVVDPYFFQTIAAVPNDWTVDSIYNKISTALNSKGYRILRLSPEGLYVTEGIVLLKEPALDHLITVSKTDEPDKATVSIKTVRTRPHANPYPKAKAYKVRIIESVMHVFS